MPIDTAAPTPAPAPPPAPAPADVAWQLVTASWTTHVVRAMAVLGIADHLAAGPQRIDDLATLTNTHAPTLERLLHALVGLGLVAGDDAGSVSLTPVGEYLRTDTPGTALPFALGVMAPHFELAWHALPDAVQTGQSVFAQVHGSNFWDYLSAHPTAGAAFDAAMSGGGDLARMLLATRDLSGVRTLVDVGGGQGRLLTGALSAMPEMHGILFDQPDVVARAGQVIDAAGVRDRCTVVGGDFFAEVPSGGDGYVLATIIHDWPDAESVEILRTCHRAMAPGARIWLIENVVTSGPGNLWTAQLDLLMLVLFGAQERSAAQYQTLLETAGFTDVAVFPVERTLSIIEAVRP